MQNGGFVLTICRKQPGCFREEYRLPDGLDWVLEIGRCAAIEFPLRQILPFRSAPDLSTSL
jgi:hypothetical protein